MRKLTVGIACAFILTLSACCGLKQQAVGAADKSQELIFPEYLQLVEKHMTKEQLDNRKKLVESARRDMEALKAAVK